MTEEKKNNKNEQNKADGSIKQANIAVIQAQLEERARLAAAKKAQASQKKPAAAKTAAPQQPKTQTASRTSAPVGKPMPKNAQPVGKAMPKSAVPQKKADVPQPEKTEAPAPAEKPAETAKPATSAYVEPKIGLKIIKKAEPKPEKPAEKATEAPKAEKKPEVKPAPKAEKKEEPKAAPKAESEKKAEPKEKPAQEVKPAEKAPEAPKAEKKPEAKPAQKTEKKEEPKKTQVDYVPNIGVKIIRRAADEPQQPKPEKRDRNQNRPQGDRNNRPARNDRSDRPERSDRPARPDSDNRQRNGNRPQGDRKPKEFVGKFNPAQKSKDGEGNTGSPRRKPAGAPIPAAHPAPAPSDNRNNRKGKGKDRDKEDRRNKFAGEDITDLSRNIKKKHSKYKEAKPVEVEVLSQEVEEAIATGGVVIDVPITVAGFCEQVECSTSAAIMALMKMGIMANVNQNLDESTAVLLGMELGITVAVKKVEETEEEAGIDMREDADSELLPRPPVITVMGHVDHGKTSILDAIRNTNVTAGEAGGITQHIGASEVICNGQRIVFLDTPGHEAFTAMRARGAHITDIAVLVVAADDSVMPQTIESISHAKAAGVPVIVAMNKMDKPTANPDKVKQDLAAQGLLVEDWGGDIICVPCSAKTGMGIQQLLEMILLQAEVLELKANPDRPAMGTVIEARLDKSRGPVATLLVMNGTLQAGAALVAGTASGRVRVMLSSKGDAIREAGPATAVEVTGLTEVPEAGDEFYMVKDDKTAREIVAKRIEKKRAEVMAKNSAMSLEKLFDQLQEGEIKDLNIIIKADVQGSVGALEQSLEKLHNENVRVRIIHTGVGTVTEGDVMLAGTSNAVIIGFNVRPSSAVQAMADQENVEIRTYRVIYEIIDDLEAAMKGMLKPVFKEVVLGKIEVRDTFRVSNVGTIAGGYVLEGKVARGAQLRLVRDGIVIHEGEISSLKRFKDDVKEVASGFECGIGIEKFNDIKVGDIIEAFKMEEVKRD